MLTADKLEETFIHSPNFHLEYALSFTNRTIDGKTYKSIGVFAKMVDMQGNEETEYINDVTTEPEIAHSLIRSLYSNWVSPMCLKTFVENFIVSC